GLLRRHRTVALGLIVAAVLGSGVWVYGQGGARGDGAPPPLPRDLAKDLALKITAPFTLAAVGDIIVSHPIGKLAEPGLQSLLTIMRGADMTFANQEGPIEESETDALVDDLKTFGIRIMGTANNHTMDL